MKFVRLLGLALFALLALAPRAARGLGSPCEGNIPLRGDIGIGLFRCLGGECAVNGETPRGFAHYFSVEPRVEKIDPEGPAHELRDGDAIVSIDDALITTREGGRRLASLTAGVPIHLRVRRAGRELLFTIVPRTGCNMPNLVVSSNPRTPGPPAEKRRANPPFDFGVRIRCGDCGWTNTGSGSGVAWRPDETPVVLSVDKGGAGEAAGLRPGDELLAIDGFSTTDRETGRPIGEITPGRPVKLTVKRAGRFLELTIVPRPYAPAR